jgi:hypothetical protein
VSGAGFDRLVFRVTRDGAPVVSQSFTDLASAEAFFTDETLDLGSVDTTKSSLNLAFSLDLTTDKLNSGFDAGLFFGNSTPGSGPPVPEPTSALLVGTGLGVLARRRRCRRQGMARCTSPGERDGL